MNEAHVVLLVLALHGPGSALLHVQLGCCAGVQGAGATPFYRLRCAHGLAERCRLSRIAVGFSEDHQPIQHRRRSCSVVHTAAATVDSRPVD
jgi:hypothetical protein